jgi:hypothetical protein
MSQRRTQGEGLDSDTFETLFTEEYDEDADLQANLWNSLVRKRMPSEASMVSAQSESINGSQLNSVKGSVRGSEKFLITSSALSS